MRRKLQARSHENARLRAGSVSSPPPSAGLTSAGEGAEGKESLRRKVRDLESEIHDLRSGHYRERKRQLSGGGGGQAADGDGDPDGDPDAIFDDVELEPPGVAEARARRAQGAYGAFSGILSSFTGNQPQHQHHQPQHQYQHQHQGQGARRPSRPSTRSDSAHKNVGFLGGEPGGEPGEAPEGEEEEADMAFDEDAFREAQEEEGRKRLERVREVKRGLEGWRGWRMDLVDLRGGGMGGVFGV